MQKDCNVQLLAIRKENVLRKAAVWGVNHENTSVMVTMRNHFNRWKKKESVGLFRHIVWPQKTSQSLLTTLYSKWLYGAWLCVSWILVWGTWILFPVALHETCGSKITSFISCQPDFTESWKTCPLGRSIHNQVDVLDCSLLSDL